MAFFKANSNLHYAMLVSLHIKCVPDFISSGFQPQCANLLNSEKLCGYAGEVAVQVMVLLIYTETPLKCIMNGHLQFLS